MRRLHPSPGTGLLLCNGRGGGSSAGEDAGTVVFFNRSVTSPAHHRLPVREGGVLHESIDAHHLIERLHGQQ